MTSNAQAILDQLKKDIGLQHQVSTRTGIQTPDVFLAVEEIRDLVAAGDAVKATGDPAPSDPPPAA